MDAGTAPYEGIIWDKFVKHHIHQSINLSILLTWHSQIVEKINV